MSRPPADEPEVYHDGPLTIDIGRRTVTYHDQPFRLTPTEFRLLATLASDPDKVFTREELAARVWGDPALGERRVIEVHILRLRQRLDEAHVTDPTIVTLRSFGYKLSPSGRARSGSPDG